LSTLVEIAQYKKECDNYGYAMIQLTPSWSEQNWTKHGKIMAFKSPKNVMKIFLAYILGEHNEKTITNTKDDNATLSHHSHTTPHIRRSYWPKKSKDPTQENYLHAIITWRKNYHQLDENTM
jgi:hypothetical protein